MTNTTEQLAEKEAAVWRRRYEYKCVFCKVKRATLKYAVSKKRVCQKCASELLIRALDAKQLKLFS